MKFINITLIAVLSISIFILGCAYTKLYTYPEWLALREDDTGGEGAEGDGGYWIQIGNDIYYNTGNVGIGTTNPTALLEVNGNVKIGAYTLPSTDGTADQVLKTNGAGVLNWANDIGGGIGDDLGSHTATSNIILGTNFLSGDGGNEGIQIGADGTVTATTLNINSVYTFPVADGTSGYVLKTDGSGNVTWQTDNAGTGGDNLGDHTATGNIILGTNYLSGDGGNEGIQIGADGTVTATILNVNSAYTLPTADGTNSQVLQTNGSGTVSWATISGSSLWTDAGTYNYSNNATNVVITDSGNVGIGMAGPNAKLEIDMASLTTTEGLRITRSAAASHYAYMSIEDESSNPIFVVVEDGSVGIGTSTPNGLVQISAGGGGTTALILGANLDIDTPATESLRIGAGGTEHMVIEAGGNIGVGTTTPGTKLDVAGTIKATGFQLGTSTTAGYVLTANASGVGTWQATGAGSGLWTDGGAYNYSNNATNVVVTDTGRVGIGTTTPSQLLDVAGNIALSTGGKIYGDTTTTYINLSDTNGSMLGYG
ncbi:MAG: hypothetical protein KAT05_09430, partial [Spirochaetes bacterium]|nr:hypothetical protein [Spirochaetota bacterium]